MSNMNIFPYQSARSSPPLLRKEYLKAITLVYTVEEIAQMLSPVQQHHRIPCSAGRRKHPHPERQFRCVAPGSLKKEITYGIYYETR